MGVFKIFIINLHNLEGFQPYKKLKIPNQGRAACCVSLEGKGSFNGKRTS